MATIYYGEILEAKGGEFVAGYCAPGTDSRVPLTSQLARLAGLKSDESTITEEARPYRVAALVDPDVIDTCENWGTRVQGLANRLGCEAKPIGSVSLAELRKVSGIVLIGFPEPPIGERNLSEIGD